MQNLTGFLSRLRRLSSWALPVAALVGAAAVSTSATADDIDVGLYLGGSLGDAQASYDADVFKVRGDNTGYKFALGWRPISLFAVEASYINFGRSYGGINYADTDAEGLFAIGFLPIPLLDVYGKLGVAEWRTDAQSPYLAFHRTGADPAYGAGVGAHWGNLGARLEYERYDVSHANDMALTSIGLTWQFL